MSHYTIDSLIGGVGLLKEFIMSLKQDPSGPIGQRALPKDIQKKEINIFMFLGAAHTGIFHHVKREHVEHPSQVFPHMPYLFWTDGEIYRRYLFGKETPDTLIARRLFEILFMEFFFYDLLKLSGNKKGQVYQFSRGVISKFSFVEIKKMYEDMKKPGFISKASFKARRKAVLDAALLGKGIRLPASHEEFIRMLPPYARKQKPDRKTK